MIRSDEYPPVSDSAPQSLEQEPLARFRKWVCSELHAQLPHRALLCGQYVRRAGGYVVMQRHAFGLPEEYLNSIAVADQNIRSPVLGRLVRSGKAQFFSTASPDPEIEPRWAVAFEAAGWRNVLALGWRVGERQDDLVATVAGFYDAADGCGGRREALQQTVMAEMHSRLQALGATRSSDRAALHLTPMQGQIGRLLAAGRTNKEIARVLGRSDYTIKKHISTMLQKAEVSNRTELTALLLRNMDT